MPPVSAKSLLPKWYKKTNSYMDNKKATRIINNTHQTTATIKKCMPVYDAITAGYFILSWADIKIFNKDNVIHYEIESPIVSDHNVRQASNHPNVDKQDDIVAKFMNPWSIQTPEGYSCLFVPPSHHSNIINIMPAIVDTDTYNIEIHFPFTLTNRLFEGVIPKGTPLVQVIPFKRDMWEMEIKELPQEDYKKSYDKLRKTNSNGYKNEFWEPKSYA